MSEPGRFVSLLLAGLGVGCQMTSPRLPEAPPAVSSEVLARFRLGGGATLSPPLEPIHVLGDSRAADLEGVNAPAATIEFEDVLASVENHFPLILAATEEIELTEARLQQARGAFDTQFGTKGKFDTEGFYQSDRLDVSLEQPTTLWGTTISGGYRLGVGDFDVYEGGDKTNEDGELRFGVRVPLFQGRAIDPRRVELWRARIAREQAGPVILEKRLETTRKAANAYWRWVSWGRRREIGVRLLALAEDRMEQIDLAVEEGLLAPVNKTENQRLIVDRQANLVKAERGLQEASIVLSLYWRDVEGRPSVPSDDALPYEFPTPRDVAEILVPNDLDYALQRRPEVRAIELELSKLELEIELAGNELLPNLDVGLFASQDFGGAVNTPDDKDPFELEALLRFEVPLQRRDARGRRREAAAEFARLAREFQFVREVVVTEAQDTASALTQSWLRIGQARENVLLANELANAERFQLRAGESDLLRVNLREQQAAVAAASLVDVLAEYFLAIAEYRAALGVPYIEVL